MSEIVVSELINPEILPTSFPKPSEADLLLRDMVQQDVHFGNGMYDSGFIRSHAEALRYLCRIGLMRPVDGYAGMVNGGDRDFCAVMR